MKTAPYARSLIRIAAALLLCLFVVEPPPAHAYIGPGAGIAFVSSLMAVIGAFLLAGLMVLTWPFRWVIRKLRYRKQQKRSRVKRVIIVGLDGQDAELTDRYLAEGMLPNFARLRDRGQYVPLQSSFPSESPVAWSSFQTGCNPGRHKVFDFLVPNHKSYLPELCSAKVTSSPRTLKLGKFRIPIGKPTIDLGRKSQPFWKTLGDNGVPSTILRVPITFPPEKFKGNMLAAMMVPDLKGSQGTFSYYSSDPEEQEVLTGGIQIPVQINDGAVKSYISGPENTMIKGNEEMQLPFEVRLNGDGGTLVIDKKSYPLEHRKFTPWIPIQFHPAPTIKVRGICRFYLKETAPHFKLYMSPINIDPDKPALPISHPFTYAIYLSKTLGRYSTLGLAEDTWGLNERILDEQAFLDQAYLIHEERELHFFDAVDKTKRGLVCCVFDITDRVQHMFWRYLEKDHPANRGKETEKHRDVIPELYKNMDDLVGRVMQRTDKMKDTVLMVMSDHGFKPFRRGVNLNTWLYQNGYLVLKGDKPSGAEWYQDVDWEKTRAYAVGLGGIYLNLKGLMAHGIVEPGDEEKQLRKEIAEKLRGLRDEAAGGQAVAEVYDTREIYSGPYVREAPDLFVGFSVGWRASWNCAVGRIDDEIFDDNVKSWSGDHCMNPPDVPGIFFCSEKMSVEDRIHIQDIGPTVLDLFGVEVPVYCDGKPVIPAKAK